MSKFQEKLKELLTENVNVDKVVASAEKKAVARVNAQISMLKAEIAEYEIELSEKEEDLDIVKFSEDFNTKEYLEIFDELEEMKEDLEVLNKTIRTWENLLKEWK